MSANPEMVTLARVSRGFSISGLASDMDVPAMTLSRYESGKSSVPESFVGRISGCLDYPTGFFYQRSGTVSGAGSDGIFHRKRRSAGARVLSRAYALAEIRRHEVAKLAPAGEFVPVPKFPSTDYDDPAKVARTVRARWRMPMGPVFNLTRLLESNGVAVFSHDFGTGFIDGFTQLSPDAPPVIHMNSALAPDRWRWTLAHELGHIVLHSDFSSDPGLVEEEANLFASEFLTPAYEIGPSLSGLCESSLYLLKTEWGVSMQSLIMLAHRIGAIPDHRKRSLFIWLSRSGYRKREPDFLDPPGEAPALPLRLVLRYAAQFGYDRASMLDYLCIGERDFALYYGAGDTVV